MTPLRRTLIASVAVVLLGAAAPAQQRLEIAPRTDSPPQNRTELWVRTFDASRRPGGEGWVFVGWENGDRAPHELRIELVGDELVRVRAAPVAMAPQSNGSLWLRVPRTGLALDLVARLETGAGTQLPAAFGSVFHTLGVLVVSSGPEASRRWTQLPLLAHQAANGDAPGDYRAPDVCVPRELPPDWRALSGYDLVIVDPRDPELTGEHVDVLLRHVRAGGRLLVAGTPAGARPELAALASPTGTVERVAVGAGLVIWHNDQKPLAVDAADEVGKALYAAPFHFDDLAGPLPPALATRTTIDEIAPLPSNLFFAIVLGYVVLVGPLGLTWFRRGGRPWLALIVVPLAGLTVTALILAVSAIREGSDARGTRHTLTWLDQPARRATVFANRSVFSIRPPAQLTPTATTLLAPGDIVGFRRGVGRSSGRYFLDLERGTVDGGLLPSRLPTALHTVQELPQRARLRFRERADGGLDLLDGAGLTTARDGGAVVVHRGGSRWFVMDGGGVLRPATAAAGMAAAQALVQSAIPADGGTSSSWPLRFLPPTHRGQLFWARLDAAPPDLDDLGLEVAWGRETHVVAGILSEADFATGSDGR